MEKPIIVTSGGSFSDIDTLACGVAYNQLLRLLGKSSKLILLGPPNESVSKTMRTWKYTYENKFEGNPKEYDYVLVDISQQSYFPDFIPSQNIIKIFDHRWDFQDIWKRKLGDRAMIEIVGACATLIWEQFKKYGFESKIDSVSANLLYTAIVSNTLNFKAQITTDRDRQAAKEILVYADLPDNWIEKYYLEIQETVLKEPLTPIKNDTKEILIGSDTYTIGQIELWDSRQFVDKYMKQLVEIVQSDENKKRFITLPSISEGVNYIICTQTKTQVLLSRAIGASFDNFLGSTDKLWLRKEIIKKLREIN